MPGAAGWLRRSLAPAPLRPPGARDERTFAALCIRCDRCAEVCPYRALRPAGWGLGLDAGTPVVRARDAPCRLCMRCPPACPSGALLPITEARDVRMGRARVVAETCYAFHGVLCRTCVDACPLGAHAIDVDGELRPRVKEGCVGCGVCEHVCPVETAAIRIVPRERAA